MIGNLSGNPVYLMAMTAGTIKKFNVRTGLSTSKQ